MGLGFDQGGIATRSFAWRTAAIALGVVFLALSRGHLLDGSQILDQRAEYGRSDTGKKKDANVGSTRLM